jgi:hypothetical protein
MDAERCELARAWEAFDRWGPVHTRPDKGPTRSKIHDLSRADVQYGMQAGLDEEGKVGIGTQATIGHEYVTWWSGRMDRLHLGEVMGKEGRDDQLQEESRAGMEQPQQSRHGKAAPRPLLRWLAEGVL